jgi:hypothetical protein
MEQAMELRRSAYGLFVFLALALAAPASALAANRFASPDDMGTGDCLSEANSCDLPTAVSSAGAGDDIFIRGDEGEYGLSAQLTNPNPIHLHGTHGRPALIFSVQSLTLQSGSSAENLYVELGGAFGDVQLLGSTANNLIVVNTGVDHAIYMEDSTLTNSVAWVPVGTASSLELDGSNTLRNVTSVALDDGGVAIDVLGRDPPPTSMTDTFVNVIARGGTGGSGIKVTEEDAVDLTLNVDHSNYSSVDVAAGSDLTKTHVNLDSTNQTAAPVFVDAANGDFHEALGSPTIDKGVNDAANGSFDSDGDARTLNGTTDIGADEAIPGSTPAPKPKPPAAPQCAYGAPGCEAICTNPTTLLVSCANFTGSAGYCPEGAPVFPQCSHPTTPQTLCRHAQGRGVVCEQTTPGQRPAAGSCASIGQSLPECNVPNREVELGCQGLNFADSVCSNVATPATYCPPTTSTGVPSCNFPSSVTLPSKPKGATAAASRKARRGTQLTVTIGCPKVLAKPRCKGTIAVDGLRTSMLRTLAKQARYSANTYRLFVPSLAAFADPFTRTADAIAKRVLGGRKLPKAVNPAAVIVELGRSDPQTTSYADSLQRAVKEYRKLAGRAKKKRRKSKRAEASRGTTTLKRFSLKSGRKRARIRVRLSAAAVRRLRRDAGNRSRAPVRVVVSFKATPRPVVRFVDFALRVR